MSNNKHLTIACFSNRANKEETTPYLVVDKYTNGIQQIMHNWARY